AVCEKLCVPVEAKSELVITAAPTSQDAALARTDARVPVSARIGEAGPLAIAAVTRTADGKRGLVGVAAPAQARTEVFCDGPTPDWALPVPRPIAGAPAGLQRFAFDLEGLPPGAQASGAALRLTAVAGDAAIEVTARLD